MSPNQMDPLLYKAAVSGDVDFLRRDSNLNQQTPENSTALHIAVAFNQPDFARKLIQLHPLLIQRANTYGDTPLHIAAKLGSSKIVELLITDEAAAATSAVQPDLENGEVRVWRRKNLVEDTALHIAVRNGHMNVVKVLMSVDLELSGFSNSANETPIFVAMEAGFMEIALLILEKSPSSPWGGTNAMTALHAAVIRTHPGRAEEEDQIQADNLSLEHIRRIIRNGLWCLDNYIQRPQSSYHIDMVKKLLEKCPTIIEKADIYGWTALHYAAHLGHIEAVKLLMDHDSSIAYLKTNEGMSALHIAAMAGHVNVTSEIIGNRPDACYVLDEKLQTVLHVAVENGRAGVVEYIVKNPNVEGVLNAVDGNGNTPLHLAAVYASINDTFYWNGNKYKILMSLILDKRVDKTVMNKEHLKAIDIVKANKEIGDLLKLRIVRKMEQAGSKQSLQRVTSRKNREKEEGINTETCSNTSQEHVTVIHQHKTNTNDSKSNNLKNISATHLLVATLIATVTFAAGFTVPGGYSNSGDKEGMPVLTSKLAFKVFLIADSLAFYCSAALILLHFFASTEKNYQLLLRFIKTAAALIYISVLGVVIAFGSGLYATLPDSSVLSTTSFVIGCFFLAYYIIGFL